LSLVAVMVLASATTTPQTDRPKIAVLDVQVTNLDKELSRVLTDVLSSAVYALGTYEVVTPRDVEAMLDMESKKQLLTCNELSCMAEIGGALGTQYIIDSSIGKVGQTYVINIKLINTAHVTVEGRISESVRGELDDVLNTIKKAVAGMFAHAGAATSAAGPGQPPSQSTAPPPAGSTTPEGVARTADAPVAGVGLAPLALWGAGAAGLVTGAVVYAVARHFVVQARADTMQLDVRDDNAKARAYEIGGWSALGIGVACVATGFLVWALTGSSDPSDQKSLRVGLAPQVMPGGAGVSVVLQPSNDWW
jgi:hypothetical protein